MFRPLTILRFVAIGTLVLWIGGFTFYAGIVIPILHEFMAESEAGEITRRVTDVLNVVGVVSVLVWSGLLVQERNSRPAWIRSLRLFAFAGTVLLLIGQGIVHRILDARLDAGTMRGFYPIHRVYVGGSTLQWGLNLGVLYLSLVLWTTREPENAP